MWLADCAAKRKTGSASIPITAACTVFCFIAAVLLLAESACASPAISSISETPAHGRIISISGTDFGSKSTGAPLRFDDFEAGTSGTALGIPWDLHYYGGDNPVPARHTAMVRHERSFQAAKVNFDEQYRSDFGIDRDGNREFFELYVSFYAYIDLRNELSRNFKIFRAYSGAPDDHSAVTLATFPANGESSWHLSLAGNTNYVYHYEQDVWRRYELWVHFTPQRIASKMWIDNRLFLDSSEGSPDSSGHGMDEIRIGHYYAHDKKICTDTGSAHYLENCGICSDGSWTATCYSDFCSGTCSFTSLACENRGGCLADIYFDDVYLDITQARAEICLASTTADRNANGTQCEIQIPTSWSDSTISIRVNQGTFQNGSRAYLYVTDAEGNTNGNGYEIVFSGEASVLPEALQNLRIQR